ncbi:MAG: prepilin-type N-terminal cleavage/methylation domain-containing protein [Minisyncoccota bacterium]
MKNDITKGFTLIELIVSIGLFASVMTIAAGAYLTIIRVDQQAQAISTGIDNLSFALETMARSIRSGSVYDCNSDTGGSTNDCSGGSNPPYNYFSFTAQDGITIITYRKNGSAIEESTDGGTSWTPLTDPSITITSLTFYASGTANARAGDYYQPYVTIVVSGTTNAGPGQPQKPFTIESSAVWRGSDL